MPTGIHAANSVLLEEAEGLASEADILIFGKPQ